MDVLVDTNVILRAIQRGHPQQPAARGAIARLRKEGNRTCVASQNLFELWTVVTRPVANNGFGLGPAQADRVLTRVERLVGRLPDSDEVYAKWRQLVVAYAVSGKETHDARLVAAMLVHGIKRILTFDRADFARYREIEVVHPDGAPR